MESDNSIKDAVEALSRAVNTYGDTSSLADSLARIHPTLRQKFFGDVVLNVIRAMALEKKDSRCDGRDECACDIAYRLWEFMKTDKEMNERFSFRDEEPTRLPFI